jgi:TolB-like protein/DNA-binding SARP family transcriptional activator
MASLQLKVLGGFTACTSSGQAVVVSGKKNQALLAYLAMNAGKRLSREKLINLLWSDRGDSHARSSLRQALFALRRDLVGIDPTPLVFDGDIVTVNLSAISTDLAKFERLATSGAVADLSFAAQLYGGEFLDGVVVRDPVFEEWLATERGRLREVLIGVLGRLLSHLTGTEAIILANRLIALDQLRESSHRTLMQVNAAQGQFEPAIRQYHICRDVLWRDLQIKPSKQTENLYREFVEGRYRASSAEKTRPTVAESEQPPPVAELELSPKSNPATAGKSAVPSAGGPSVAVLPFTNMSVDPEQRYASNGITEDIITGLSRFHELRVIARRSSLLLRGNYEKHITQELGVRYLVEGSVRRSAEGIRVTAQLMNAVTGNYLWADRFDRCLGDALAIQDEVVQAIVAKVAGRIEVMEAERARRAQPENMAAYDCLLRGLEHARNMSREETSRAGYWFEKALEHDPNYPAALAKLAGRKGKESLFQRSTELLDQALCLATRAVALDPYDGLTHAQLAYVHLYGLSHGCGSHAIAAEEMDIALRLNPNDPDLMVLCALQYTYSGQSGAALRLVERAEQLNPSIPNWYGSNRAFALFELRRYAEAAEALERVTSPAHWDHYYLAACYANMGRSSEAHQQITKTIERFPDLTLSYLAPTTWYADPVDLEHLLDSLGKAGMPA